MRLSLFTFLSSYPAAAEPDVALIGRDRGDTGRRPLCHVLAQPAEVMEWLHPSTTDVDQGVVARAPARSCSHCVSHRVIRKGPSRLSASDEQHDKDDDEDEYDRSDANVHAGSMPGMAPCV